MNPEFYRLNIDDVLSNLSLSTDYDIGGEGHSIIVAEEDLDDVISELVEDFKNLIEYHFVPCEEEEEEE